MTRRTLIVHQPVAPCHFAVFRAGDVVHAQREPFASDELVGVFLVEGVGYGDVRGDVECVGLDGDGVLGSVGRNQVCIGSRGSL